MNMPLNAMQCIMPYVKGNCIDIGCEDGRNLQLLPKGSIGVDIKKFPDCENVVVHDLNRMPWPFPDNAFDTVLFTHTLEHLESPYLALLEAKRMMKNDGTLILAVPNADYFLSETQLAKPYHLHAYTERTIRDLVKKTGFWLKGKYCNWPIYRSYKFGRVVNMMNRLLPMKIFQSDIWLVCGKEIPIPTSSGECAILSMRGE